MTNWTLSEREGLDQPSGPGGRAGVLLRTSAGYLTVETSQRSPIATASVSASSFSATSRGRLPSASTTASAEIDLCRRKALAVTPVGLTPPFKKTCQPTAASPAERNRHHRQPPKGTFWRLVGLPSIPLLLCRSVGRSALTVGRLLVRSLEEALCETPPPQKATKVREQPKLWIIRRKTASALYYSC